MIAVVAAVVVVGALVAFAVFALPGMVPGFGPGGDTGEAATDSDSLSGNDTSDTAAEAASGPDAVAPEGDGTGDDGPDGDGTNGDGSDSSAGTDDASDDDFDESDDTNTDDGDSDAETNDSDSSDDESSDGDSEGSDDSGDSDNSDDSDDSSADESDDSNDSDDSAASDGETHTLVVDGQQASTSTYRVAVSGELTPLRGGTDDDTIGPDGSTLSGQVDDGYDAYEFTGDLRQVQVSGKAVVKVDGEVVARAGGATDQRPDDQNDRGDPPYALRAVTGDTWGATLYTPSGSQEYNGGTDTFIVPEGMEWVQLQGYSQGEAVDLQFLEDGETERTVSTTNEDAAIRFERGESAERLSGSAAVTVDGDADWSGYLLATYPVDGGQVTTLEYVAGGDRITVPGNPSGVALDYATWDGEEVSVTVDGPDGQSASGSGTAGTVDLGTVDTVTLKP